MRKLGLIYAISWNEAEIREILNLRINRLVKDQYRASQTVTFSDIFNFYIGDVRADDFIINRTMLRPRDAIDFVNLCLAECDGNVELNEKIVLEAEEKYFATRKNALVKEWKSIFPHIRDYLDSLSFLKNNEFKVEGLDDEVKDKTLNYLLERPEQVINDEMHNKRTINFDELIKVWFIVGVIGFKKSSEITIYSSYEKHELDITDFNKTFRIHPLFFRV